MNKLNSRTKNIGFESVNNSSGKILASVKPSPKLKVFPANRNNVKINAPDKYRKLFLGVLIKR